MAVRLRGRRTETFVALVLTGQIPREATGKPDAERAWTKLVAVEGCARLDNRGSSFQAAA
jgi:hypothetical protein